MKFRQKGNGTRVFIRHEQEGEKGSEKEWIDGGSPEEVMALLKAVMCDSINECYQMKQNFMDNDHKGFSTDYARDYHHGFHAGIEVFLRHINNL